MAAQVRILIVDDDDAILEFLADALEAEDVETIASNDPERGWELVQQKRPDIVLLDLVMPKLTGMELLERIVAFDPGIDVVLLTAHYSTESAVEAIQKGACDYLNKPISTAALRERIGRLASEVRRRRQASAAEGALLDASEFEGMVGHSPLMLEVFSRIRRVAPHYRTALITAPSGAGKELVASAMHRLSPVAQGRFVVCNCSAIVETLFESELFGHVKGAFTGATQDRIGLFEYAHGGTLFLDEIGDMPLAMQSKLLRALQNQEIQRVGSPAVRKVDVHIVAATNRDLPAMIQEKQFREDLFYRLSVVEIRLPRLADRKEDLPLLVQHFLRRFSTQYGKPVAAVSRRAQAALARHAWPGNVRELENALSSAVMEAHGDTIDVRDLPERFQGASEYSPIPESGEGLPTLEEVERRYVRHVLEEMGGNKVKTASALGISRATLYRMLEE
jgi:DNA-binding NtrC family response regulator